MTIVKDIVADYGAPTNGTSDPRAAFLAFKADAQGLDAYLTCPPHTYTFAANGGSADDTFVFEGISSLVVDAPGATFTGVETVYGVRGMPNASPQSSARIASAARGQQTVSLITSADHSLLSVGDWVMAAAFDVQGSGSPPNPAICEYLQIQSKDALAGTVTFATALKYDYLSTFPSYFAGSALSPDEGGPATLYVMPTGWGWSALFLGLTFDIPTQTYIRGRSITLRGVTALGAAGAIPTLNQLWDADGCNFSSYHMEVDKCIETMILRGGTICDQLDFQSSAPNLVIVDNATASFNGTPRKLILRNGSIISSLAMGPTGYGRTDQIIASDSTVSAMVVAGTFADVEDYTSISLGVVSFTDVAVPIPWAEPGTNLVFKGAQDNDARAQVISTATSGPVKTLVTTDLPGGWPDVPKNGGTLLRVGPHPCPSLRFSNIVGCADSVDHSQAGAFNRPLYSYSKRTYSGDDLVSPAAVNLWGKITRIDVRVLVAYAGAGALTLKPFAQFAAGALDPPTYSSLTAWAPSVNLKVAGTRTWIVGVGWSGTQAGDSLADPGQVYMTGQQTPFPSANTAGKVFTIEIEVSTDQEIDQIPLDDEPAPIRVSTPDPFTADDLVNLRHHQDELRKAERRRSKDKVEHAHRLRDAVEEMYDRLSGIAPAAAAKVAAVIPAKAKFTETATTAEADTPAIDWSKVTSAQIAKVIATMDAYAAQLDAEQRQQAIARADAARRQDEDDIETLLMAL